MEDGAQATRRQKPRGAQVGRRLEEMNRRLDGVTHDMGERLVDAAILDGIVPMDEREAAIAEYVNDPAGTRRALEEAGEMLWAGHAVELGIATPEDVERVRALYADEGEGSYREEASNRFGIPREELL
jgi:hypothetical protein